MNHGDFWRPDLFSAEIYVTIKYSGGDFPYPRSYSIPCGQLEGYPEFCHALQYHSAAYTFLYLGQGNVTHPNWSLLFALEWLPYATTEATQSHSEVLGIVRAFS